MVFPSNWVLARIAAVLKKNGGQLFWTPNRIFLDPKFLLHFFRPQITLFWTPTLFLVLSPPSTHYLTLHTFYCTQNLASRETEWRSSVWVEEWNHEVLGWSWDSGVIDYGELDSAIYFEIRAVPKSAELRNSVPRESTNFVTMANKLALQSPTTLFHIMKVYLDRTLFYPQRCDHGAP